MYRDKTNVEPEMYDYTSNNWSQCNSNEKLKEKFGSCNRKTFDWFTTKGSYTWNITHNTESTAVWSLKPERWGSPLVQERYQEEKACDKRHAYRMITGETGDIRGDWDCFKVIQKICEQHTRKTWSQRTPENSHIGHCTHTSESTNVRVQ